MKIYNVPLLRVLPITSMAEKDWFLGFTWMSFARMSYECQVLRKMRTHKSDHIYNFHQTDTFMEK